MADPTIGSQYGVSFKDWLTIAEQTDAKVKGLDASQQRAMYAQVMATPVTENAPSGDIAQTASQPLYDVTGTVIKLFLGGANHPTSSKAYIAGTAGLTGRASFTASSDQSTTLGPDVTPQQKADVQQANAANPSTSSLTSGPFSAQSAPTSLFASGGLDPTTVVAGMMSADPGAGTTGGGHPGMSAVPGPVAVNQTVDKWLTNLYKMSPSALSALQLKMYAAGWYDPTSVPTPSAISFGRPDPATIAAFEQAMTETARYNAAGKPMTIDDVIAQGGAAPKAKKTPLQPSEAFHNPTDIAAAGQAQAQTTIGMDMTPAQAAGFATYYQALEKAQYAQYAQAGVDRVQGGGGAYTALPDPGNAAEAYLKQNDPAQVAAYGMASRMNEFQQMLGSAQGTL